MMELTYQDRTKAKIKWAVNCYNSWRNMRLDRGVCNLEIVNADFVELLLLTKENLEYSMCRFICEVKKSKEEGDYPGHTLYEMTCCIQTYLKKKGITWKLVHADDFPRFQCVLDRVMQECVAQCIGTTCKRVEVISMEYESKLWEHNVLGEDSADKLRNTTLYLIGFNCTFRAGDEHYALHCPGDCIGSQFTFEKNVDGVRCLVYHKDFVIKTNKGHLKDMTKEHKVVWIKPNNDKTCCSEFTSHYWSETQSVSTVFA